MNNRQQERNHSCPMASINNLKKFRTIWGTSIWASLWGNTLGRLMEEGRPTLNVAYISLCAWIATENERKHWAEHGQSPHSSSLLPVWCDPLPPCLLHFDQLWSTVKQKKSPFLIRCFWHSMLSQQRKYTKDNCKQKKNANKHTERKKHTRIQSTRVKCQTLQELSNRS